MTNDTRFRVGFLHRPMHEAFQQHARGEPALELDCIAQDTPEDAILAALERCHGYYVRASPPPSGADFREETIYFLLTARYYDGDPANY